MKKKLIVIISLSLIILSGCASKKNDVLKDMATPYKEPEIQLGKNDDQKLLLRKDINAFQALQSNDGIVYQDIVSFDVYTRPTRLNYDGYFVVIPEGWQKLYVDSSGIYLNYIPIKK
jgi:hypothetical protein